MSSPSFLRAALGLALLLVACGKDPAPEAPAPIPMRHGIPLTGLTVRDTVLPSGATLASLLNRYGQGPAITHALAEACQGLYELKRMRAGDSITLLLDSASGHLRHLILRPDAVSRLHLDIDSVPKATLIPLKVDTVQRLAQGVITTSLWEALVAKGHSPALVGRVADILAWQVDFFALQPGDSFQVAYEEFQVDGKGVEQGTIHAVRFRQDETISEDFRFVRGKVDGYFDAQGHPSHRAFLRAPLQFSRISSHFTGARMHPVLRIVRPHHGVDYAAPAGTPVMAVGDGVVIMKGWSGGGGNTIKIRHENGCMTGYLHLQGFARGVATGKRVRQGEVIAWVGSTGISTGPHLDFRFWKNGQPVNPLKVVTPPPPPLPDSLLPALKQEIARIRGLMQAAGKASEGSARP